ncbi:hypothetical protein QFC22_004779 [Naganishia vaughanmartiniae]|uniref:Uncharacterized protein n=1 Tax=Naganishia vaughanmartiniae TaxID=1424756 RepID=A0ACC2WZ05_9TREE|nr:hypothetical protein QFC22_004779 [Naganishia vaughanmartiniae]
MNLRICTTLSRHIPPLIQHQHHQFSTTAPTLKKFKPQPLYLQPGERKARKCKIPKKLLERRAAREGYARVPAERAAAQLDGQGQEIFPELDEEGLVGLWKSTKGGLHEADEDEEVMAAHAAPTYDYNHKPRRAVDQEVEYEDSPRRESRESGPFGLGRRAQLYRAGDAVPPQSHNETAMGRRLRETKASLVDLGSSSSQPSLSQSSTSTQSPSTPSPPPKLEIHPETIVPAWKIPTQKEYERYGAGARKSQGGAAGVGGARERSGSRSRVEGAGGRDTSFLSRTRSASGAEDKPTGQRVEEGWSDRAGFRTGGARRDTRTPTYGQQASYHNTNNQHATRAHEHPSSSSSDNQSAIIVPPTERTPGRWEPTKKISIPAMQGLRELHASDPQTFTHGVLGEKFGISREAVARILRSRFREGQ